MIDERTKEMISYYIPNPPDPTLPDGAYYWLQYTAGETGKPRVLVVYPLDILSRHEGTEYGIYQQRGGRLCRIDAGYGDPYRGVRMYDLYDNKQDCIDQTHMGEDSWESLRRIWRQETAHT